ncbi:MAG TPA: SurA N-terminal domain-containing protein [Candidatus Paceibacterota bacterium]
MNTKKIIVAILLLAIVGGGAYAYFVKYKKQPEVTKVETVSVAKVNGVDITKAAFDSQLALAITTLKAQGVADADSAEKLPTLKTQVLNDLINNELVNQGIAIAKISATQQEVDTQRASLVTQLGGEDKLKIEMDKAGLTEVKLMENITRQVLVQKYLIANINVASTTVTEAEISKFYKDNSAGQTNPPALKDVKEQIRQQITLNKQQVLVNEFLVALRAKAAISTDTSKL